MTQTENADNEASSASTSAALPAQLVDLCRALADNSKIVFKSQQIDDPELNHKEKQEIAQDAYNKSRKNFLIRFGNYMNEQQLNDIQELAILEAGTKSNESMDDINLVVEDLKRKLHTRNVCVKNRRYNAMQELLQKGEYFSEHEMMQRAPELYQELVGQYLTEAEKKARDSYDVRNTSFSGILMHTLEKKQRDELLQQVELSSETMHDDTSVSTAVECEVPKVCRKHWGGFDDEPVACSTIRNTSTAASSSAVNVGRIITPEYYNPRERELLRNEFMGLMKERFLSGKDSDFDYSGVDDNVQLDDLQQIERDEEDAYFDGSDDDDEGHEDEAQSVVLQEDDHEDDLDIYMRHLNKHPSLQQH